MNDHSGGQNAALRWLDDTVFDLGRQFRWSYLPPLMIYLAAGMQGIFLIVGTFFVKEYLDLSAAAIAGLLFWAGVPWTLKMPLGHLVDLIWRHKAALVYLGASLLTLSIGIMYLVIAHPDMMIEMLPIKTWYVIAYLLTPVGYVVQDVVADAMTVEAVPIADDQGNPYSEAEIKVMHTTMQTLGRFSLVTGLISVAILNIWIFDGIDGLTQPEKAEVYARVYLVAFAIPVISILGVNLGSLFQRRRARMLERRGFDAERIREMLFAPPEHTEPNWWILGGGLVFAVFTLGIGLSEIPLSQEIIFVGSMAIVLFLMQRLLLELDPDKRLMLIGTAVIVFVFRAVPLPGEGLRWFEIDELGFDPQFLSVLSLITAMVALFAMLLLRPLMAKKSIAYVVVFLSLALGIMSLPSIGMYYGLHEWTSPRTGGVVDARFIAILDTALESPLVHISMIPLLAWIAKNAPAHLKATFFAVMASFTNLALSASSLSTRYMNQIFDVTREVRDRTSGAIEVAADYSELGMLLIAVGLITVGAPLLAVVLVQRSRLKTRE